MKSTAALVLIGLLSPALAAPKPESVKRAPAPNHGRAGEVRAAFQTAWKGYYKYAFPHDTLLPLTNQFYDDRNEWGLTPFDALSTAIIMNEADIVNQILDFVPSIDFTTSPKTDQSTSLFESTIRYLGGMLSSYDLLKGPYKRLPKDPKKVDALLKQAESLADTLSVAFTTPSGLPDGQVILTPTPHKQGNPTSGLAEMGTLILEWTRLSDLTGNPKYKALVDKAEGYLIHPTGSPEAWPGLVGGDISTETGKFVNSDGGWSGGTDSFYEYLIKMYLYDPKEYEYYKERWVLAADNTMAHLASHPTTRQDLTFLNQYSGQTTYPVTGHLTSFAGGNFILAGLLLKEEKYTKFGLDLAESYFQTYNQTASGIGPEVFRWIDSANPQGAPPADQLDFYNKAGFWVDAADYVLRPETIESLYYAYRATGDKKWQDLAYQCFKAILKQCRGGSGFSGIKDVTKPDGGGQDNFQQSFFLAEALKYSYLINIDDQDVQVKTENNQFVFNTEAHPMKIRHA